MEKKNEGKLTRLSIEGFKSIRELKALEMRNLNILIGANGSGKSNFIDIFRFLRAIVNQNFAEYVNCYGTADKFLFNGAKQTMNIKAHLAFDRTEYRIETWRTIDHKFQILNEEIKSKQYDWQIVSSNCFESKLKDVKNQAPAKGSYAATQNLYNAIANTMIYHFQDTGNSAALKAASGATDNRRLKQDASNIAAVLLAMKKNHNIEYRYLVKILKLIAPYFDDFVLEPQKSGQTDVVKLLWEQKGSDSIMEPFQFSDGTLRFICLLTAMMQPNPPSLIIIEEPELGLHPEAINIISDVMMTVSEKTQIIAATQSSILIDYFDPEDIIVVNREDGSSTFRRLKTEELNIWLEEYTLGQLWRKNVVEGGTQYEGP